MNEAETCCPQQLMLVAVAPCRFAAPFQSIAVASSLFTKDPQYWKSVHLVGQGLARERQEAKQRELDAWKAKVWTCNADHDTASAFSRQAPGVSEPLVGKPGGQCGAC